MDFWDLTKLLFRRWYVAAPLLVVTALIGAWTYSTVKPDYKGVSYVQLVPPPAPTAKDAQIRNPWVDLGLGSLNTAATYATADTAFLAQLKQSGLSDNVIIDTGYPAPIATITVVATSKAQAINTMEAVVQRFNETVKSLQDSYGVQQASMIVTRRLDTGQNLEETGGKVKRALIAVLGAGMLVTVGVTVGFDAIARRRARRRSGDPTDADLSLDESLDHPGEADAQRMDDRMPRAGSRGRSNVPIRMNRTGEETIILPRPQLDRTKARRSPGDTPRIVRQHTAVNGSATADDSAASDRTMVLPRAGTDSPGSDSGSQRA